MKLDSVARALGREQLFSTEELLALTGQGEIGIYAGYETVRRQVLEGAASQLAFACGGPSCSLNDLPGFLTLMEAWYSRTTDASTFIGIGDQNYTRFFGDIPELSSIEAGRYPIVVWGNPPAGSAQYDFLEKQYQAALAVNPSLAEQDWWLYVGNTSPNNVMSAVRRPSRGDRPILGDPVWFLVVSSAQRSTLCGGDCVRP